MNEDFLQFVWLHKLYQAHDLFTHNGQKLEIIHPGIRNSDSGPDFFNAKIKLDDTLWAGNVEIHIKEQDWYLHGHDKDKSYDNVILHVVAEANQPTLTSTKRKVPVWQMTLSNGLFARYQNLFFNKEWIPCGSELSGLDSFTVDQWLDRMLVERMEEKNAQIETLLQYTKNDWDQVFFILLARSFGFSINGQPFEMMAKQTPLKILLKYSNNLKQIEALLFGQAGLLDNLQYSDDYVNELKNEYDFLSKKHQLKRIDKHLWKFLRLRPTNFPSVRIAQLAALIHINKGIFSNLQTHVSIKESKEAFSITASEYWDNHYLVGKISSKQAPKHIGNKSKHLIIYNTLYPYLFVYHSKHNNQKEKNELLDLLYQQVPEDNRILSEWKKCGITIKNEARAQSLIFLKNHYCNHKKCLNCHIGHNVLSKSEE